MSIVPRGMTVTEAYRLYRSGNLLVNRKYQRKLIWSVDEKEKLIGSLLKGYPIPLILLAERPQVHGSGKYEIIDGMQRLNAICGFIENLFAFKGRYFDLNEFSYAKQLADDKVFEFEESLDKLDRKECADILDYQLAVTIYTAMDESDITEVFGRINSGGKHLSNQERRQAGVTTSFAEVVRTIAMQLRGDDTRKTLRLFDMPQVSIDSKQNNQGYGIQAEDTLWCKQGILSIADLRDSKDEDMIADIAASILLNQPLKRSRERLDSLYDEESNEFQLIENSLATYGFKKLEEDIVKTFSLLGGSIETYSSDSKCLQNIVNPGINNPIPQAFYTIFMAFFELIIDSELRPANPQKIMQALKKLQQKLQLSKRYAAITDRIKNINQTKGLIQDYFAKKDKSTLGQGAELIQTFKNSLLRSRIETAKYECKQGFLDLSPTSRKLNDGLPQRLVETICGIANSDPDTDGYIFIGVADKKEDAEKIKKLDEINPIEINDRYVVGIDREAKFLGKTLEDHVGILINAIKKSALTDPLKTQVLTKIDTICYKGCSVIRINIPSQKEVSFVGEKAFIREDTSTVEAKGQKLMAVFQSFQK
ncbi:MULTISPECIES: GmrSD restriction endonuclease domain-containing protein [unclassified Microcoleus]|uniref:GmrSD restriction endonuclease domain-containing protein n=1 Tax=unclassified Microcoleus TaxID=2642155 RepID=UPI002FD40929